MRYYFSVRNGGFHDDLEGTEYPDPEHARVAATQYAGELIQHYPEMAWENNELEVRVANDRDHLLFTVLVQTTGPDSRAEKIRHDGVH